MISPLSVFLHCFTHSFLFLYMNFDFFTFCRSRLLDLEHLWCYHLFQIMHFSSKVYFLFKLTLPCNKPYKVELNYNWIAWFTSIYDSVYGSHCFVCKLCWIWRFYLVIKCLQIFSNHINYQVPQISSLS